MKTPEEILTAVRQAESVMKTQWETRSSISWKIGEFIDSAFLILKQQMDDARQEVLDKKRSSIEA